MRRKNRYTERRKGIVTPYGQWKYPGEVTTIPSNDITMKGVPYPVLGVSDKGDTKMMFPDGEYRFKGNEVTEYPIDKYATGMELHNPLKNMVITSRFSNLYPRVFKDGRKRNSPHYGIDLRADIGTDLYSTGDGIIKKIVDNPTGKAGKYIVVESPNHTLHTYMHLDSISDSLKKGQSVKAGDIIGKTGNSGTKYPHLHYQVQLLPEGTTFEDFNGINDERIIDRVINPALYDWSQYNGYGLPPMQDKEVYSFSDNIGPSYFPMINPMDTTYYESNNNEKLSNETNTDIMDKKYNYKTPAKLMFAPLFKQQSGGIGKYLEGNYVDFPMARNRWKPQEEYNDSSWANFLGAGLGALVPVSMALWNKYGKSDNDVNHKKLLKGIIGKNIIDFISPKARLTDAPIPNISQNNNFVDNNDYELKFDESQRSIPNVFQSDINEFNTNINKIKNIYNLFHNPVTKQKQDIENDSVPRYKTFDIPIDKVFTNEKWNFTPPMIGYTKDIPKINYKFPFKSQFGKYLSGNYVNNVISQWNNKFAESISKGDSIANMVGTGINAAASVAGSVLNQWGVENKKQYWMTATKEQQGNNTGTMAEIERGEVISTPNGMSIANPNANYHELYTNQNENNGTIVNLSNDVNKDVAKNPALSRKSVRVNKYTSARRHGRSFIFPSTVGIGGLLEPKNGIEYPMAENINDSKYGTGGSINIKPSKRGTFTAAATKHGMGVQQFASKVLANPDNYSEAMRKKAQFARNSSHWKHQDGGNTDPREAYMQSSYRSWYDTLTNNGIDKNKAYNLAWYLALQDAKESSYGTSRFAKEYNNHGGMLIGGKPVCYKDYKSYLSTKFNDIKTKYKALLDNEINSIDDFYKAINANPDYQYAPADVNPNYLNDLKNMKSAQKWLNKYRDSFFDNTYNINNMYPVINSLQLGGIMGLHKKRNLK